MEPMESLEDLKNRQKVLINYLVEKVKECDWHGVSDAANDLRVLEAKMEKLNNFPQP